MNFPQKIHKKMPVLRSLDEGGNFTTKNSINPSFGARYVSFDASSERTAGIGFSVLSACPPKPFILRSLGAVRWRRRRHFAN